MKSLKPNEMNKLRSRRLRKKLRVGEFQEFGVTIDLTFNQTVLEFEQALDELLAYVEAQGCVFGGGGSMTGKSGEPLVLIVPPGTQIIDDQTNEVLFDLLEVGEKVLFLDGNDIHSEFISYSEPGSIVKLPSLFLTTYG